MSNIPSRQPPEVVAPACQGRRRDGQASSRSKFGQRTRRPRERRFSAAGSIHASSAREPVALDLDQRVVACRGRRVAEHHKELEDAEMSSLSACHRPAHEGKLARRLAARVTDSAPLDGRPPPRCSTTTGETTRRMGRGASAAASSRRGARSGPPPAGGSRPARAEATSADEECRSGWSREPERGYTTARHSAARAGEDYGHARSATSEATSQLGGAPCELLGEAEQEATRRASFAASRPLHERRRAGLILAAEIIGASSRSPLRSAASSRSAAGSTCATSGARAACRAATAAPSRATALPATAYGGKSDSRLIVGQTAASKI